MIIVYRWPGDTTHLSLCVTRSNIPIYISYFPAKFNSKADFRLHTFEMDSKTHQFNEVIILPSVEENGYGLSEQAIYDWWQSEFATKKPGFNWVKYNCARIVLDAIKNGAKNSNALIEKLSQYKPIFNIHTPDGVMMFLKGFSAEMKETYKTSKLLNCIDDCLQVIDQDEESMPIIRQLLCLTSYITHIENHLIHLSFPTMHFKYLQENFNDLIESICKYLKNELNITLPTNSKELVIMLATSDCIDEIIECKIAIKFEEWRTSIKASLEGLRMKLELYSAKNTKEIEQKEIISYATLKAEVTRSFWHKNVCNEYVEGSSIPGTIFTMTRGT
jgi:hypothetical protein